MKKIVEQGLLYDFYGELLTDHQKEIYEAAVYNDMSLTEIAEENGISKQGVSDMIKRCTNTLQGYEDKLHMIRRFEAIQSTAQMLRELSDTVTDNDRLRDDIRSISDRIIEELT